MPLQMVVHEGGNEIIGMVVAIVHAQRQVDIRTLDRLFEQPRTQTFFEETVALP